MTAEEIYKDSLKAGAYLVAQPFFYLYETWKYTEHSLKENTERLEEQHKLLFATLALTNNTYCNLYKKFYPAFVKLKAQGIDYTKSAQYKTLIKLGTTILLKAHDWIATQKELEAKAGIKKITFTQSDFLNAAKATTLLLYAQTFFKKGVSGVEIGQSMMQGIGSPVIAIVWAAAIIGGGITLAYIVNRMTISTQDRLDLLNATKQTCIDLNLTPEQCTSVMNTAQVEETHNADNVTNTASEIGGGITKILMIGALLFFGLPLLTSKKTSNT